jgi:hypothetical protein
MKYFLFVACLSFLSLMANAQFNYFVEENGGIEKLAKQKLINARQNVINSIVGSDYILKTSYSTLSPNQFTVRMVVIDSLTFKPVIEDNENYLLTRRHKNMNAALRLAFQAMMEKNLSRILEAVETNRLQARELKSFKDKS